MRELTLTIQSGQLIEVSFYDAVTATIRRCTRGKTAGAYKNHGTFQWTAAVRGLVQLAAKACLSPESPEVAGFAPSPAASLDYAIAKQPQWLVELFGADGNGICNARRAILRTNPERKRPGPVVLALNSNYIPHDKIKIIIDSEEASSNHLASLIAKMQPEVGSCVS